MSRAAIPALIANASKLVAALPAVYLLGGPPRAGERIRINDNRLPSGVLIGRVLKLDLEARVGTWHPDDDDGPGTEVQAFAERGHAALIPGPLIRVPAGTTVDLSLRNDVANTVLLVRGLASRPANGRADTSVLAVPAGATRRMRFRLDVPGTYYYWGTTSGRRFGVRIHEDAQLSGAIVVDDDAPKPGAATTPHDRIFVVGMMGDTTGGEDLREDRKNLLFVINGRSWPHTERLSYSLGDTIRWRVLNTTVDPHPMHLHGTYYRVDSRGDGTRDSTFVADDRDVVNTEFLAPGGTMTMAWSPEHAGNWLFHCHIPEHFGPRGPLGVLPASTGEMHGAANHAVQGMAGLVMGITVRPTTSATSLGMDQPRRRLRLLVRTNVGSTTQSPYYGFTIHEHGAEPAIDSGFRTGPPIVLERGQPVSITVVNRTGVPTSVHWHGIELESFYDGVPGFSGDDGNLSPAIAPGDSFEARFTPPRAGTFMYHTHVDEGRQQRAGLAGMLLVLEPERHYDPARDLSILISSPADTASEAHRVLLNGSLLPPALHLRRDVHYRLRFGNMTTGRPGMRVQLVRDGLLLAWTPVAKDGADLPAARRVMEPARQRISIGETMDFEVTPATSGPMQLEMVTVAGTILATVPIEVGS